MRHLCSPRRLLLLLLIVAGSSRHLTALPLSPLSPQSFPLAMADARAASADEAKRDIMEASNVVRDDSSIGGLTTFNIEHGYLEAMLRGFKSGFLKSFEVGRTAGPGGTAVGVGFKRCRCGLWQSLACMRAHASMNVCVCICLSRRIFPVFSVHSTASCASARLWRM